MSSRTGRIGHAPPGGELVVQLVEQPVHPRVVDAGRRRSTRRTARPGSAAAVERRGSSLCGLTANSGSMRTSRAFGSASSSCSRRPAYAAWPDAAPAGSRRRTRPGRPGARRRCRDGPQPPARGDRHVGDLGRGVRGGLDQADHVGVVLLAEVDRERRPAVVHRRGRRQRLPPVQVTERDVVGVDREDRRPARCTRRSTARPARRRRTCRRCTVRCAITRLTVWSVNGPVRLAEDVADHLVVGADVLGRGVWAISWAARTAYRWDRNGSTATTASSPVERAREAVPRRPGRRTADCRPG